MYNESFSSETEPWIWSHGYDSILTELAKMLGCAASETQEQAAPHPKRPGHRKCFWRLLITADVPISQIKLEFLYVLKLQRAFKKIKRFALVIYRGKLKVVIICMQGHSSFIQFEEFTHFIKNVLESASFLILISRKDKCW